MNILLITSEDNGPHFGCYGDPFARTPHLDRLAGEGARFTNAYVTQAVCSPGRASILTGMYPHQNGQIGLATHRFAMFDAFPTIPALLKDVGYRTGRIGKLHILPEAAAPFDMIWNDKDYWSFQNHDIERGARIAGDFMAEADQPFFLMMNFSDAHLPWYDEDRGYPREPQTANDVEVLPGIGCNSQRLREQTASYYNCLSRLDSGIGLVLEELDRCGKADDTVVLYITDHGPQFSRGKCCIRELSLRAPLLLRWPGVTEAGTVRHELVSQIDVLPTLLEAAGVELPEGLPGASLRPLSGREAAEWRDYLFAEWTSSHINRGHHILNPQRSVRDGRYKLIVNMLPGQPNPVEHYYTQQLLVQSGSNQAEIDAAPPLVRETYARWRRQPEIELYDLLNDPWEYINLADQPDYAAPRERLLGVLRRWQEETHDLLVDPANLQLLVDEHQRLCQEGHTHKAPDFRWDYLDYLNPEQATRP